MSARLHKLLESFMPILFDRSRVTADWRCPRSRYLGYEYNGRGLSATVEDLALFVGTTLHTGLAAITRGVKGINEVADEAATTTKAFIFALMEGEPESTTSAHEQASLVEGLLRGFDKHQWPKLRATYPDILLIEQEMNLELPGGLVFMSRPDLVVRDRAGDCCYIEYKSTSSNKDQWITSWTTAVQLHSTTRAIEHSLHEKVSRIVVQGLYKGFKSYGKLSSPFVYAYVKKGAPPFTQDLVEYEYKQGYFRCPVWDREGQVKAWVEGMPDHVLANQFPQTPPIFYKPELIDSFFRQRAAREVEIALASEQVQQVGEKSDVGQQVLDEVFPQKFDACDPAYGKPCLFKRICHGNVDDPLRTGFSLRVPHHELELEKVSESIGSSPVHPFTEIARHALTEDNS